MLEALLDDDDDDGNDDDDVGAIYGASDTCGDYPQGFTESACAGPKCRAVEACSLWSQRPFCTRVQVIAYMGQSVGYTGSTHRGLPSVLAYFSARCQSTKQKHAEYYGIKGFIIEIWPFLKSERCEGSKGLLASERIKESFM